MSDTCQIEGCDAQVQFVITRDNRAEDTARRVCRKCAQEVTAIHGWVFDKLIKTEANK